MSKGMDKKKEVKKKPAKTTKEKKAAKVAKKSSKSSSDPGPGGCAQALFPGRRLRSFYARHLPHRRDGDSCLESRVLWALYAVSRRPRLAKVRIYSVSTFSRAQGVLRRNVRLDLIEGSVLKQLTFIFAAIPSQP